MATTADPESRPLGFTCNAFSAVSPEPPLLPVCAGNASRTLPALLLRGAFAVRLLAEDGERVAGVFAGRGPDTFQGLPWRPARTVPGVPVLEEGVPAHTECTLARSVEVADHTLLVGRTESLRVHPRRPALHQRGSFRAWPHAAEEGVRA
ncbi:monooxygenase [Streptomyces griseoviridis]|nr:monooxygenase [Streptomyces griseoviridis]